MVTAVWPRAITGAPGAVGRLPGAVAGVLEMAISTPEAGRARHDVYFSAADDRYLRFFL